MSIFNTLSEKEPKLNKAVIACDGRGNGCVIYCIGDIISLKVIDLDFCKSNLEDLNFEDAPHGISIWEGIYNIKKNNVYNTDYYALPKGTFRNPTEEEWKCIMNNKSPFLYNEHEVEK